MEPKTSIVSSSSSKPSNPNPNPKNRDFLIHLEAYLAKRDGVDKLLKISRYASKIILASSVIPESLPLSLRLKSFESSVGVSRKAFRLGKFVQDVNALRSANISSKEDLLLSILAYGGEGLYYFVEQFVWFGKAGLIDKKNLNSLQKISAWCEFIGYIGSVSLKVKELSQISEDEQCLLSTREVSMIRGIGFADEEEKLRKLRLKKLMKRLSVIQDFADGLMALADISDGKGMLSAPLLLSSAGLLSALISTHKNWISC
ncbi:peroxisomal membrane protein 11A [Solanum tuberosum]|uniref:Peroxisomal biogenesis factor n=1 Tax=Solanum tuberosum TaxID=4113 RepID=M1CP02_SOLTU|nr:PREDICTED: peroxisomal membrane protein 11A [Solanum tuberosum]